MSSQRTSPCASCWCVQDRIESKEFPTMTPANNSDLVPNRILAALADTESLITQFQLPVCRWIVSIYVPGLDSRSSYSDGPILTCEQLHDMKPDFAKPWVL